MQEIDVAAYIWPSYTGKEPRTTIFWPQGNGEWETVKEAKPKFEGHLWPREPLLGYKDEAEPETMEEQIEVATSHGVNVFIYDWYWFDGRPFLEQCLNGGFLKAKNNGKMKFYLMWANHDVNYTWDRRISDTPNQPLIWRGKTTPEDYKIICKHWLEDYFTLPNYYKIDGKPLISIYDLNNFVETFGSIKETKKAMKYLDKEAKKYGLKGVCFQLICYGFTRRVNLSGVDGGALLNDVAKQLPFESFTNYQYCHFTDINRDYNEVMQDVYEAWDKYQETFGSYMPHVSIGWDNNPRFKKLMGHILKNNTPENFGLALQKAKEFAVKNGTKMITINSWNEWTEGSYLLPDSLYGYGYLDEVKNTVL